MALDMSRYTRCGRLDASGIVREERCRPSERLMHYGRYIGSIDKPETPIERLRSVLLPRRNVAMWHRKHMAFFIYCEAPRKPVHNPGIRNDSRKRCPACCMPGGAHLPIGRAGPGSHAPDSTGGEGQAILATLSELHKKHPYAKLEVNIYPHCAGLCCQAHAAVRQGMLIW